MEEFDKHYKALNERQREAVDVIDGPVMVVAGPGTGKTQLLSMRVANILRRTDVLPQNILCLTFTDSGAVAMRERLLKIIGQPAYKVAVHTFHSFGSDIINSNADYFYKGAHFRPADELSSYEALRTIFDKLQHDNPLASTMNGDYTYLREVQRAISDLKKSGLTPDELLKILDHNEAFVGVANREISKAFADRLSKKSLVNIREALNEIGKHEDGELAVSLFRPLSRIVLSSLESALDDAEESHSTKPVSAWKKRWCEKDEKGDTVLKDTKRFTKLRALSDVYYSYLVAMQERELYDFDDMILRVVHASEVFPELRYNLQEQYQYILVDEFQDTNDAQMRLLYNLTNNPINEGRPNILVVGDDDQAIYRFQGAEIGNIMSFQEAYPELKKVTLVDNYRSDVAILSTARPVIVQAEERLENFDESINKNLTAHHKAETPEVSLHGFVNHLHQYQWIAEKVKALLTSDTSANEIAIIGRNHKQLQQILPHLQKAGLPLSYERQDDVLENEVIRTIELLAKAITTLSSQKLNDFDAYLPEILSHPMWSIPPLDIWKLSLKAYKERRLWLELMLEDNGKLKDIAEWMIVSSHAALHEPLEIMLDHLVGSEESQVAENDTDDALQPFGDGPEELFISPLRAYYFGQEKMQDSPEKYLTHLLSLSTIRRRLREYRPDTNLKLSDFCDYVDMYRRLGLRMPIEDEFRPELSCVSLMTAHKAKGLEFGAVFIIDANNNVWGSSARGGIQSLSFPENLPIRPSGDTDDERLRLLYVAMTRAKDQLFISFPHTDINGKKVELVEYLALPELPVAEHDGSVMDTSETVESLLTDWKQQIALPKTLEVKQLLAPHLEKYQLSATHLNNFIDITRGGPQAFLLQNLLRFPQAMSPQASLGSAIHGALQRAHSHLCATGKRRPIEDVLHDFENLLGTHPLSKRDMEHYLQKGSDILGFYLKQHYDDFKSEQIAERRFNDQGVVINSARLTGAIDLISPSNESEGIVTVIDYKTGKPAARWFGKNDAEKIKLHKYKQQLMFYKLLIENSRDFGGKYKVNSGVIEFVEPYTDGTLKRLEHAFDQADTERFINLIGAIWKSIMNFDFPDTSDYEQSYTGVLKFEDDLLSRS